MAEDNNNFRYTYKAPTEEERREIEAIKREYSAPKREENKLDELKKLDNLVKTLPRILGISMGILGVLAFGLGMSMVMVWDFMLGGIIVSVVGALIITFGYFIYRWVLNRNKKKYAGRILELTEELLNKKEN